jgi:rRNA maturation protein Rpf1
LAKKPFILLTTSRRPTKNMRSLCRDLSHTFPNTVRINRGKLSLEGVAEKALELDAEKATIVERWKGGMGKIRFFRISKKGLHSVPPLIYIRGVKLRRDFGENTMKRRRMKSLAVASSRTAPLKVKRLENALSEFFNIPILPFDEVTNKKCDIAMQISTDQSNSVIVTFKLVPELVEAGPQIRISHLVWELIG